MTAQDETRRLFVGIPLPDDLLGFVRTAQEMLPTCDVLRITRDDQLHVTLCFLGEVGGEAAEAAVRVVSELPCTMGGTVWLGGYLCLPSAGRTRVVALEVADRAGIAAGLFEAVASGLEREAGYARETRPFKPHLTIGRFRKPVRLGLSADMKPVPFTIGSVCLYESTLSREGARYRVLQSARFDIEERKNDL